MTRRTFYFRTLYLGFIMVIWGDFTLANQLTRTTYNDLGLVSTVDGSRIDVNDITTYGYDTQGNRTLIRNALGHEIQITSHDTSGRPLTLVDANGLATTLTYDSRGRMTSQAHSDGATTLITFYSYDSTGNLIQVSRPDGVTLNYDYDVGRRLVGLVDNLGNRIDFTLDAMGNRTSEQIFDTDGIVRYTSHRVYDELGRLIQLIDAHNQITAFQYDANGNLTQHIDANLNPTAQAYDTYNRANQTTDALNGFTRYTYDSQGNLAGVTDPNGFTTSYTYDGLGNLISQTSPDTGTTSYTNDEAGNRLSQTDARGITVSYTYDALNRLIDIQYPDPGLDVSFEYDQRASGIGRLTRMSDANGDTDYSYDAFGHLTTQTRNSGTLSTSFQYAYDGAGRLVSFTYPSGASVLYGYDSQGKIHSLQLQTPDGSSQTLVKNLQYMPFGPLQAFDYGNDLNLSRSFDQDYRLIQQTIPGILENRYQYDPVGNITDWFDLLDIGRDQQFTYDLLDRLVSATGTYGALGYSYDATGNRLIETDGIGTAIYSYAVDSHRLLTISDATTDNRMYDAAGNTLHREGDSFEYDQTNRLIRYTRAGVLAEYAYNGKGERIRKTVNGVTTRFRYGTDGQLLGEYDETGNAIREYVYLEGMPVGMLSGITLSTPGTVTYLHTDHLGAVIRATDQNQQLVWDALRTPFGKRTTLIAQVEMPLGFPGQYYDQESGLYYNYFKDYDPSTGRYIQSDPIGLAGGLNTHAYVDSNPINRTDPLGLFWIIEKQYQQAHAEALIKYGEYWSNLTEAVAGAVPAGKATGAACKVVNKNKKEIICAVLGLCAKELPDGKWSPDKTDVDTRKIIEEIMRQKPKPPHTHLPKR